MIDGVDKKTKSRLMAGIRGRDTRPELKVRRYLHAAGLRFTLHSSRLPGKPDIALRKYRTTILVHWCFWHRRKAPWATHLATKHWRRQGRQPSIELATFRGSHACAHFKESGKTMKFIHTADIHLDSPLRGISA